MWYIYLDSLTNNHNSTKHLVTKVSPKNVDEKNAPEVSVQKFGGNIDEEINSKFSSKVFCRLYDSMIKYNPNPIKFSVESKFLVSQQRKQFIKVICNDGEAKFIVFRTFLARSHL